MRPYKNKYNIFRKLERYLINDKHILQYFESLFFISVTFFGIVEMKAMQLTIFTLERILRKISMILHHNIGKFKGNIESTSARTRSKIYK